MSGAVPPRLVVVAGEPGAGKSRPMARFAAEAAQVDHMVLYGAAPRDPGSGYAPIITSLRSGLAALRPEARSSVLAGTAGRELSRLLPDLGGPGREVLHSIDGPGAERLLLDGIAEVLWRLAEQVNGLTLVVDDLQWAADAVLAVVRRLVAPAAPPGVTVAGVIRSSDVAHLTTLIADVSRRDDVVRLELRRLPADDIAALVSEARPTLRDDEVQRAADELQARTGGNALFVASLLHTTDWIDADGAGDRSQELPAELSAAIAERLAGLDQHEVDVLTAASVIGQRFPARLLAEVVGRSPAAISSTVRRGRRDGLLEDVGGGEVAFVHDLLRVALMPPDGSYELAALHRSIAEQLEREPDPDTPATASHFLAGIEAGADVEKAVMWSVRAAELSMRQLAYLQAARQYQEALQLLAPGDRRQFELMIQRGRAQLLGGDPAYRTVLPDAVDRCLDADEPALAAEAALSNNRGLHSAAGEVDHERIAALERVLETEQDPSVSSQLTATLAVESVCTGAPLAHLADLSQDAVDLARRSGDGVALAHALTLRQDANYRIDNIAERLAETHELLELTANGGRRGRGRSVARGGTDGRRGRRHRLGDACSGARVVRRGAPWGLGDPAGGPPRGAAHH